MKRIIKTLITGIVTGAMILGLGACGAGNPAAPAGASDTSTATEASAGGLKICIVTSSGVDDGSFNQNVYEGIQAFIANHSDCTVKDVKESDLTKLIGTVESLVGDYDVFVLPGFNFAGIGDIAQANPDKKFIVVDSAITDSEGNAPTLDNVYTMTFKEEESGFFAGIAAAETTQSGKVAVINGIAFPSNVNYQFGFMSGVNYANAKFGTKAEYVEIPSYAGQATVEVKGMGSNIGGNYVGDFADEATGKTVAEALIGQGCDVLFMAAGSSGNGCFTAIKESSGVYAIGCDVDQYDDGANGSSNIILTSALKVMDMNVEKQLNAIYDGTFEGRDDTLGADTGSTGYVSAEGRQQLSDKALEDLATAFAALEAGEVEPASNFNGYLPDDFPGLK